MKQLVLCVLFLLSYAAVQAQADITVYPNPATEYIEVSDQSDAAGTVNIYNLVGKKLRSFEYIPGHQYFLADLPKGMYLVQILDRSGKVMTTQKVNKR